jgi:hypothetical protein
MPDLDLIKQGNRRARNWHRRFAKGRCEDDRGLGG